MKKYIKVKTVSVYDIDHAITFDRNEKLQQLMYNSGSQINLKSFLLDKKKQKNIQLYAVEFEAFLRLQ